MSIYVYAHIYMFLLQECTFLVHKKLTLFLSTKNENIGNKL